MLPWDDLLSVQFNSVQTQASATTQMNKREIEQGDIKQTRHENRFKHPFISILREDEIHK